MPARTHWFRKRPLPPSVYRFFKAGAGRLMLFAAPVVLLAVTLLIWPASEPVPDQTPAPATENRSSELLEQVRQQADAAAQTQQAVTVLAEELAGIREDYQQLREQHQALRQELSETRAELERLRSEAE